MTTSCSRVLEVETDVIFFLDHRIIKTTYEKNWISPFGIDIPTLVVLMVVSTIKSLFIADNFLPRLSSDTKLNGKGKNGG